MNNYLYIPGCAGYSELIRHADEFSPFDGRQIQREQNLRPQSSSETSKKAPSS